MTRHPRASSATALVLLCGLGPATLCAATTARTDQEPAPARRASSIPVASVTVPAAASLPVFDPALDFVAPRVTLLRVDITDPADAARLAPLGFDVIDDRPGAWAHVIGWPGDAERLAAAGLRYTVEEADFGRALAERSGAVPPARSAGQRAPDVLPREDAAANPAAGAPAPLSGGTQILAVPPEGSGSLGGYYSPSEVYALMDSLAAFDAAGIVTTVQTIGTTIQGRPIKALGIFRESPPDTTRPRVLFTSLTHAREPEGMQVLMRFMRNLVSQYGTDPNLTYLVNNREIWFVPVVNPDGYQYNYNTWFTTSTFGLWRKNLHDNNGSGTITSADGVDINRNFGFNWGFDNSGSSNTPSSEAYRGLSAFSEPETRALRDFVNLKKFKTAQNYHTYWEVCLYPWGYNSTVCPDSTVYRRLVDDMMREPVYATGVPNDLLYPVNGDANDWMYGDQVQKPKVLAVTTEVGTQNDGFWPPAARIPVLAAAHQRSNQVLAYAAGAYVNAKDAALVSSDGWWHPGNSARLRVTLQNGGLAASDAGGVTVTASCGTAGVSLLDATSTFAALPPGQSAGPVGGDLLEVWAAPTLAPGTKVPVFLDISDAAGYALRDTVIAFVGQPTTVLYDDCRTLSRWTSAGGWGLQIAQANSDTVFSDSPAGNYANNADARLTLTGVLDLSGTSHAWLSFKTTWDIEGGYDWGTVEASTNNGTSWTALAGRLTRAGHGTASNYAGGRQSNGGPGYDMNKRIEDAELIDLSAYAGVTNLKLRFRLLADSGTTGKGWFVDDILVRAYGPDLAAAGEPPAGTGGTPLLGLAAATPNPFTAGTRVTATFARTTPYRVAVFGVDGRLVRILSEGMAAPGARDFSWDGRTADGASAASGQYYIQVDAPGGRQTARVLRVH